MRVKVVLFGWDFLTVGLPALPYRFNFEVDCAKKIASSVAVYYSQLKFKYEDIFSRLEFVAVGLFSQKMNL